MKQEIAGNLPDNEIHTLGESLQKASSRDVAIAFLAVELCQIHPTVSFEDSEDIDCRPSQFPLRSQFSYILF